MNMELSQKAKSFWSRPEGKTGMLFLAGIFGGIVYAWGTIVPFLVSMMQNTLHLMLLGGAVAALITIAMSPKTHMLLRMLMRWVTGVFITIDPIGILKDRLQQMRKRREDMEEQVQNVRGAVGTLKKTMEDNRRNSDRLRREAQEAQRQSIETQDPESRLRKASLAKVSANEAVRLEKANERYMDLLLRLEKIYKMLTTLGVSIDTYIQDTQNEVRQQEIQHKTIGAAHKAFSSAMRVLKGNVTEEDLYNTTMEYLADEAGRKLGEMEDMQRLAQTFMDKIDVQNGALDAEALKMFESYETKLLNPAASPAQVPAAKSTVSVPTGSYGGFFKK